jgi:hypothetical protein
LNGILGLAAHHHQVIHIDLCDIPLLSRRRFVDAMNKFSFNDNLASLFKVIFYNTYLFSPENEIMPLSVLGLIGCQRQRREFLSLLERFNLRVFP